MKTPKKLDRVTEIKINLPEESFYSKATRDILTKEFIIHKYSCTIKLNGKENISDELAKKLPCIKLLYLLIWLIHEVKRPWNYYS